MNEFSLDNIVKEAKKEHCRISDIAKKRECIELDINEEKLMLQMKKMYDVMKEVVSTGVENPSVSVSGLTGGEGYKLWQHINNNGINNVYVEAAARSMGVAGVNAAMGRVVAAPTAGSCGILPGVIFTVAEKLNKSEEEIIDALFTAGYVGKIIAHNASISGAEGGCQAECGSASAMAAAGIGELLGATPDQIAHSVAFTLKAVMGLICDPVAGLVEVPCIKRNGFGAVQAILAIDMALAGIESVIPPDEVIKTMGEVGNLMPPAFKETAEGGIAISPTGKSIAEALQGGTCRIK